MTINKQKLISSISLLVLFYYFTFQPILTSKFFGFNQGFIVKISFVIIVLIYFKEFIKNIYQYKFFIFFIVYMSTYFVYYYIFPSEHITIEVHIFQAKVILYAIFNILLAKALFDNFENKNLKIGVFFSLSCLSLLFISFFDFNTLRYTSFHQVIGGTLPFVGILAFIFVKDKKIKFFIATLVLIMLYFIQSRASFYSFVVVYAFFIIKELGVKKSLYLFFTILAISSFLYLSNIIEPNKRMLGVSKISQDGSFSERIEQFKYGFEAIKDNWFLGDYAGQVISKEGSKYSAGLGAYMHNWISFYRQYGLVFFLIFSMYYLYLYFKIFLQFIKNNDKKIETSFYFGTYILICLLFFHSYSYPYFWFAFSFMNFVYLEIKSKKLC